MKILYTLNSSNFGGMEKTVLDLVKGLPGFVKYIVCPDGDYFNEFREFGHVYKFRSVKKIDFEYIKFLRKIIIENNIQVVHANEPKIVFNTLLATIFSPVKVRITHTHTPISMWRVSFFNKIINLIFNSVVVNLFATYEIALTDSIKKRKIREGILPSKLKIISNALDSKFMHEIDTYKPNPLDRSFLKKTFSPNKFSFLFLSRFTKEKNQILLIEAFYTFYKKNPESELILAGKGADYSTIKKKIRDLNLVNQVKLITEVSERDKINLYLNCNAFVFPSLAEGFGITLLEAMYSCYPVISSDLEVLKEVSKNKVMFFKSNNIKSLLSKMQESLRESNNLEKLNSNKDFIRKNYTIEKYISNYLKVYQQ